ncbi:hypothetical protein FBR02_19680, partial [Anaerolineae bacterium CFX9]|nr:hypothetical protein [Anaerolineae bacterium CFX9]
MAAQFTGNAARAGRKRHLSFPDRVLDSSQHCADHRPQYHHQDHQSTVKLSDFDYTLPEHFIAQTPVEPRDSSRLMVLNREKDTLEHRIFRDIGDYLNPGDVLVLNTTRVIPARLYGTKAETGGSVEVLLLRQHDALRWHVLVGGRRILAGTRLNFGDRISATVEHVLDESERIIAFDEPVNDLLDEIGQMPLPPYINTPLLDTERYQTVF